MRIMVALSRFPYPLTKGDKLRAYRQLAELSRHHELYLVCLATERRWRSYYDEVAQLCTGLHVVRHPLGRRLWNLVQGIFARRPLQAAYFRSPAAEQKLSELAKQVQPDLLYLQLVRMAPNLPADLSVPKVLDYMDAFSAGMARRAELTPWPLKLIVRNEARRLARYEAALAPAFQALTIISEADRDQLSPAVAQRVQIVPNGVNRAFLQPPAEQPKPIDLIFTGNMSYYPNVQAAKYLVQELLPALADVSLNVFLVGTSPSSQVKALANEQVTVTGYVADLRPYLAQAKLFVAPLFSGSGLQNKLLEAMGMHVPVITTPNAHRALGGEPDKTLAVCKDKAAFVASIHRLLASPREAERMGAAGHAYVVRNYDWQVFNQQLEAIFAAAGSPHSAVAAPKVDHA